MRHTAAPLAIAAAIALVPAIAKSDTATWIGGTGNWTDATKWDTGDVPGLTTNVVIDGDENVASVVTLASAEAVAVEALTIDEGDSLSIRKTNNGSQNFNFAYIDNAGALTMASHANGNAQTTTVKVNGDGSFWNKESGMITISGVAARNRTVINFVIPSGSRNDGKITLTQDSSDRNNSSIRIEKKRSADEQRRN